MAVPTNTATGGPSTPTLVYLYGPPAAGKLTVAERLVELTGAKLFHNHLTVNALVPVFEFGSPAFTSVLHRLRIDVLATAAEAGHDVVFTNNSAWSGEDGRARFVEFVDQVTQAVGERGGRTVFVQVVAPEDVLVGRLTNASRQAHGKLVDPERLRALLGAHDPTPLHPDDLIVDTGLLTADEAARHVADQLAGR